MRSYRTGGVTLALTLAIVILVQGCSRDADPLGPIQVGPEFAEVGGQSGSGGGSHCSDDPFSCPYGDFEWCPAECSCCYTP